MIRRFLLSIALMALPAIAQADVCHRFGPLLPATCVAGECFQLTTMPRGFYDCTTTDVWTVWGLDPVDDSVQMANGLIWESKIIPDCVGEALTYTSATNTFACVPVIPVLPAIARMSADQSSTVNVFATVTGLTFALVPNTSYSIACELAYITAAPNTALQLSLNGPASPTSLRWTVSTVISTSASHHHSQSAYDATANPATAANPAATLPARLTGTIENGPNAGTLALRMRSEVLASSVTIQRGSWCALY